MKRINKTTARKLWENGGNFIIVPCKCSPRGLGALYTICDLGKQEREISFETFINSFTFYNCNSETGRYPAYYIEE